MKNTLSFVLFLGLMAVASVAYAHPASDVVLTLDAKAKLLSVQITHQVGDPTKHYIDQVSVTLNGQTAISQTLTKQDTAAGETLTFTLPDVKNGDVVTVDTHCNKGGNLKKELELNF